MNAAIPVHIITSGQILIVSVSLVIPVSKRNQKPVRWGDTMSKFCIEIEMENETMQTHHDIQKALKKVIRDLDIVANGSIWDSNGNKVGLFWFEM